MTSRDIAKATETRTLEHGLTGRYNIESAPVHNATLQSFNGRLFVNRTYTVRDTIDESLVGFGNRRFAQDLIDSLEAEYLSEEQS